MPQMRLIRRSCFAMGCALCLAAIGAGPRSLPRIAASGKAACTSSGRGHPMSRRPPALYPMSLKADALYSYRGRQITTYWRSGHAEAVIISHRAPRLRRIDYLAPDIERGRSVVTDGSRSGSTIPQTRQLLHRRSEPDADAVADAAENYDLLRTNYVLQVVPQTKTWADRKTFLLTITRKTDRTAARKLWIDAATGLGAEAGKLSGRRQTGRDGGVLGY